MQLLLFCQVIFRSNLCVEKNQLIIRILIYVPMILDLQPIIKIYKSTQYLAHGLK